MTTPWTWEVRGAQRSRGKGSNRREGRGREDGNDGQRAPHASWALPAGTVMPAGILPYRPSHDSGVWRRRGVFWGPRIAKDPVSLVPYVSLGCTRSIRPLDAAVSSQHSIVIVVRRHHAVHFFNPIDCLPIRDIFNGFIMSANKDDQPVICSSKDVAECVQLEHSARSSDPSLEKLEQHREITPRDIQARFDLLRDLSDAEMEKLNKSVVKKIDWRMMPTITMMFLMR